MRDNKNHPLYTIIFEDESIFEGGTIMNTKWLEIPNKKIDRIFYKLPTNDFMCLSGYDKYFHYIEAVQDLNGKERGKVKIENIYLMGRKENKVKSYRITLTNKPFDKHKVGDITVRNFDINDDRIAKLNKKGWK